MAPAGFGSFAGEAFRLTRYNNLEDVRAAWSVLQARAQVHPFQSLDWHGAWASVAGLKQEDTVIVVLRDAAANVLGLWPMHTVKRSGAPRWLMPMAQLESDYCSPLIAPELAAAAGPSGLAWLFGEVLASAGDIDGWAAKGQPEDQAWYNTGAVIRAPQRAYLANMGSDFQSWHDATRSRASRKKDRYRDKQLAAAGGVVFEVAGGGATAVAITTRAIAMKRAQMAAKGLDSSFERQSICDTYLEVARNPDGPLKAFQLTIDGKPRATAICLASGKRLCYVIASFEPDDLAKWSPGAGLLRMVMRWASENGFEVFDFTVGDEDYKLSWSDQEIALVCATGGVTAAGKLHAGLLRLRLKGEALIRRNDKLLGFVQRARRRVRQLRSS